MASLTSQQSLWSQVLAGAARKVSPQSFETWFAPLDFAGCDAVTLRITVPNLYFKDCFLKSYSTLLEETIAEAAGSTLKLVISFHETSSQSSTRTVEGLPVLQAVDLEKQTSTTPWLIERLWTMQAVGVLAGQPKSNKTWLALDMAVSVASASPCLATFPVHRAGPVLVYAAEESPSDLRFRLQSLATIRGLDLDGLDVRVITADSLRLDLEPDQDKLQATVFDHRPALLVLDPLIRVHRADENASSAMSAILAYFRSLQRHTGTAILLVHHLRKNPSSAATGYSLRGSSDLYAWLDSLLFLHRRNDQILLTAEHRSAPSSGPFPLKLVTSSPHPHLQILKASSLTPDQDPVLSQVLDFLACSPHPPTADAIRATLHVRKQRLLDALRCLSSRGQIVRRDGSYALPSPSSSRP